jgi:DNA-binding beta-propeller fold protein YncE
MLSSSPVENVLPVASGGLWSGRRARGGRSFTRSLLAVAVAFCVAVTVVVMAGGVSVALAAPGELTQKPGTAGCISDSSTTGCVDGTALSGAQSVTVSPDGKSAYVASSGTNLQGNAVAVFDRAGDGTLTQKPGTAGCISDTGSFDLCVDGRALKGARSVTVSPDGKNAYVASNGGGFSSAVAVFDRATDGTLTQKPGTAGCISEFDGPGCAGGGTGLGSPSSVTVSPDGTSAYVTSGGFSSAVAVFDRAADGTLTQKPGTAACISSRRGPGPCTDGRALEAAQSVTVSPDGKSAYVASAGAGAVAVFDRAADGTLTQKPDVAGCISDDGFGPCADGRALEAAQSVTVSPDGKSAYVASGNPYESVGAVAVFDRAADGTLTQKPGMAGCISHDGFGPCVAGRALLGAQSVTVSPDGKNAYVASIGNEALAVFDVDAPCANVPCDPAVFDVAPNSVGTGSRATIMLRGRDLDLLESARFLRDGTILNGKLEPAAPNAGTRIAQLDTGAAVTGAYDLEASFTDGVTRTLESALTVTSPRPAAVTLALVGRSVFRPGSGSTITVQASNSGNVDAYGVILILGGFPAGSTITPQGGVTEISGSPENPALQTRPFDQTRGAVATPDGLVAPFLIPKVPASSSVQLRFRVTVPVRADYRIKVVGGPCFDQLAPPIRATPRSYAFRAATPAEDCSFGLMKTAFAMGDAFVSNLPGVACVTLARDILVDVMVTTITDDAPMTLENAFGWSIGAASCAADFSPLKPVKVAGQVASFLWSEYQAYKAGYACAEALSEGVLDQNPAVSHDPNDMIGPAGAGTKRYMPGDGDLLYQVLFENLPAATAPAQRVEVTNQLDTTKFDPATVRFRGIEFGDTVLPLPNPVTEVDETVDLRPANDLLVHITAEAKPNGRIKWIFQAIAPETGAPPEDPLAGFLPPNGSDHEGEGATSYTVRLKNVPEGAEVTNDASIVFDTNAPIETPTWSNVIDRSPPIVTLSAVRAGDPQAAAVTWGGTDAASGISRWDIMVSKDGETPTLWQTAREPGSAVYIAPAPGTYAFRATAHDGAMNSTVSTQSEVALSVPETTPEPLPAPQATPPETLPAPKTTRPETTPPASSLGNSVGQVKKAVCAGLRATALKKCQTEQRVIKSCSKLKGSKKTICGKRVRALARCDDISTKTRKSMAKRTKCVRKAKAIGRPRKRERRG